MIASPTSPAMPRSPVASEEVGHRTTSAGRLFTDPFSDECRRCGRPISQLARYCGGCGLRLQPVSTPERERYCRAMRRGLLLRQRGPAWYRLAIRSFRVALNNQTGAPEPVLEIARTYAQAGCPRRARSWYRFLLRQIPDHVEAWLAGANTYAAYDHFHRACWISQALVRRPEDENIRCLLDRHFARLAGWQRWWIEQRLWQACQGESLEGPARS